MKQVHDELAAKSVYKKEERRKHVKDIQVAIQEDKRKVTSGVCPKCSSPLVQRRGKNGAFIGCSGYPKCRFTKNV
ncbi:MULTISPECIES: topoisomerase DNA-binding C4 zinc finger domain-containing protein [unclassified Paenibacillus]|uniref:topoisomerase DNA-binding C4 zinc finger domain-containing protein n=1 Tax=unclassified Paenibacillus TaxID=185978 RepID=UPI001C11F509|nr:MULTISPECIES: topoisomerase DNA-binding C4 zinc finger domain-containing protein [unclassified Paenibacillus]MBU5445169.1 topoisomerase DNA-binding C4 zinc finger domain-containing protein [Paenibacillus sp. MSJ-34]